MEFTVIFRAKQSQQIVYQLAFNPHPVWRNGEDWYLEMNPEKPDYEYGSVRKLLEREVYIVDYLHDSKECMVICDASHRDHPNLKKLTKDLEDESFRVKKHCFE